MFAKPRHTRSGLSDTLAFLEQVYVGTVRGMRKSSGWNAVLGLIGSMMQAVIFIMAFYFMFQLMGVRSSPIKGDYMLYIISGIAMFMTHNTAVQAVAGAEGPTSGMMQHAPMNTMIAVCSAALQKSLSTNNYHRNNPAHLPPCLQPRRYFQPNWLGRCVFAQLVYRRRHWHGFFGVNTMAPATRENSFDGLSSAEHVGIRQNVRCQYTAILHVGHV